MTDPNGAGEVLRLTRRSRPDALRAAVEQAIRWLDEGRPADFISLWLRAVLDLDDALVREQAGQLPDTDERTTP